ILFIFCVLASEGMNAIVFGGEKGGRGQKSTACLEGISVREFYLLTLSIMLTFFQVSLMIR
ncbi:MAG: hypothetical protein JTJ12_10560, partial [Eubacterium sp.]|nr:hypothetical protein [Eubacterium sp.]